MSGMSVTVIYHGISLTVLYMYENSNFILYQRVMIVPEISKVKLKKIA